ncbi:MAG: recombinase family protein [Chloroflexi bacterium]|nr:recombinase family protein [Chloroflexota bacterium]
MRAAVYLRTSTQEQHPENQLPEITGYCQRNGHDIVAVYQEQESAWRSGRQIELRRLLTDCQNGRPFDLLVVWSLDRLSRQGIASILNLITMLRLSSVRVVSLKESWMETDGPMQELLLAVFGWAAQYESRIKSERTLAGLARARAEGKKLGRPKGSKDKEKRNRRGYLLRYHRPANKRGLKTKGEFSDLPR